MSHAMNIMMLPDRAITLIYEYDMTYHRIQFQKMLKELVWTASIFHMIHDQKTFYNSPAEAIEFKSDEE